jgi:hypothetical protein
MRLQIEQFEIKKSGIGRDYKAGIVRLKNDGF